MPKAAVKADPAACCNGLEPQHSLVMAAEVSSFFSLRLHVWYSAERLSYVNYLLGWVILKDLPLQEFETNT